MIALLLAAFLALPAQAQEWNSACFGGLNDSQTAATLPDCESPDMLNVESNLNGTAMLKRKGFAKSADLTIATGPVTGSHSFIDSSGNRLDIVCQDRNCAKSTNGNAFATFLTTAASGITRWSFVDQGGILYGANNKYDPIMKYDGTTRSSPATMPLGSILALTQDRLAVGDISTLPNRVHYSSAGAFEQFTVGVNPEDSFFDDIGAEGDRIRGIKCLQGNCFLFKTASITVCEMADQYNTRCSVISPNVGTTDPASIVAAGPDLYFRAQDKNYWRIGRGGLEQISKKIPSLVKSQSGGLGGGENTNTQTTKADWEAGVQLPLLSWNTATTNGSIQPSSATLSDDTTTLFNLGSCAGCGFNSGGEIAFIGVSSTYSIRYEADVLPASDGWDRVFYNGTESVSGSSLTISAGIYYTRAISTRISATKSLVFRVKSGVGSSGGITCGGFSTALGTQFGGGSICYDVGGANGTVKYKTGDMNGAAILSESYDASKTYSTFTIIVSTPLGIYFYRDGVFKTSATNTFSDASPYVIFGNVAGNGSGSIANYDFVYFSTRSASPSGISDIASISTFTSRILDTAFSTPTPGTFFSTQTLPTGTAVTYAVRVSSSPNNDLWDSYQELGATPARPTLAVKRYWQYKITLKHGNLTESPGITGVGLTAATTGQFRTACIQPNSSISAWGTLSCAQTIVGNGSEVFYATSAATCGGLPTTHPVDAAGAVQSGWTAQTNNATVTIATNTAVYIGWRSLLGSATDQAQVDACVLAWNEGTPAQPSWAAYDSVKNAIYWTSTINSASSTNRLLKYDLNLEQWYPFDIAAQAPRVINNSLYFGGASAGTWNLYGGVDADAGAAINAYRTSKDIGSDRPFQAKSFERVSVLSRNNGSGNLTGTWTLSNAKTGAYTISLSTGTGISYARSNYKLPLSSPQQFMNLKIGNNSATPFEVLGMGIYWSVLPWRVEGP